MSLKLINSSNIEITGALPNACSVVGSYYLGYGRNAWHSTWVNTYQPNSVSFDLDDLKQRAEKQRVQGNVFKIQSIPMLKLQYPKNTFGIVPINERGPSQYENLRKRIVQDSLPNFWVHLPDSSSNWLLSFALEGEVGASEKFVPITYRSYSNGSKYRLGWTDKNPIDGFDSFVIFCASLSGLLTPLSA